MRLRVLGSSGSSPAPDHPASGYLVSTKETTIWLDAGSGTFMALMEIMSPADVDAIVISHRHSDHCAALFGFFEYMAYGLGGDLPVRLYVPEGLGQHLAAFVQADEHHVFHKVFEVVTVGEGDAAVVGEMTLAFAAAHHAVPTIATKVAAAGRSLVYSGDTGPGGGVAELAADANVLLCEATLQGPAEDRDYPFHLTAAEAGALATQAGVGKLVVTHVPPTLDPCVSVEEAKAEFAGEVLLATPGLLVDV